MFSQIQKRIPPGAAPAKTAPRPGFFTPCAGEDSLLNKLRAAAKNAGGDGGTVFLSPTDFGFDQIQDEQHLGEAYLPDDNLTCLGISEENFRAKNEPKKSTNNHLKERTQTALIK